MKQITQTDKIINHIASGDIQALRQEIRGKDGVSIKYFRALYFYLCEPGKIDHLKEFPGFFSVPLDSDRYEETSNEVAQAFETGLTSLSDYALNACHVIAICYEEMKKNNALHLLKPYYDK